MSMLLTIRNSILPLAILVYYSIKRFFSGVHACVNGADATTNWTNVRSMYKCKVCECIDTVYTCMNSWKEPFDIYNLLMWIFSLFWSLNWSQACLQSDTIVVSRRWTPYCLCWLYKKKRSSSYERIQNKQVTVLWSNQETRKRYTLII